MGRPKPPKSRPSWKHMSPGQREAMGRRWRDEGSRFARGFNSFLEQIRKAQPGEEPEDTRGDLAETVLEAVREANQSGELARLREQFPPAYFPFLERLPANGQHLAPLLWLNNGQIVVRVGGPREPGTTYRIDDLHIETLPGILSFGRSPDRKYYALARESGITVHDGWGGPEVTRLDWPALVTRHGVPTCRQLIPFPDGKRVLLASGVAIIVLEPQQSTVLYPQDPEMTGHVWLDNPHGAVSPDGSLIAIGDRLTCAHLIFNDRYELVGKLAGLVDLAPCHASFSDDGRSLALSSSLMYEGATVIVPTHRFPGLVFADSDRERFWLSQATWPEMRRSLRDFDKDLLVLDSFARAYVSAWRPGEFILGDAQGGLWAFDRDGEVRWHHFIGSSGNGIDLSLDGRRLITSTCAGLLVILDLDTGEADPYRIGTSTHREQRRWLFWRNEDQPLAW